MNELKQKIGPDPCEIHQMLSTLRGWVWVNMMFKKGEKYNQKHSVLGVQKT